MLWEYGSETRRINAIINKDAKTMMNNLRFLEKEIEKWKNSPVRRDMILAERYYQGDQDILYTSRTIIGEDGTLVPVENLPDNRIVDNQYQKCVDQKKNYLLSKDITITAERKDYEEQLKFIFNKKFTRTLKRVGTDAINGGIGYLHPYYDEFGKLCFKRFNNYEIIPFWNDNEHTELESFGRLYQVEGYEGETEKTYEFFELYSKKGVERYEVDGGHLIPDFYHLSSSHYIIQTRDNKGNQQEAMYNWKKVPLIVFKRNSHEIPLIKCCKDLQDGINLMISTFENNMCEDSRNTILVLVNYDGENLGEFRKNLSQFSAVKVRSTGQGGSGDVRTITIQVNAENYKSILEVFKQALIENAKSYDAKDARLTGDANQMHIQTIYQDIELDAQEMETEFQAAFEEMLWFIEKHLSNTGKGDYEHVKVDITFNRNMLTNETELIDNCIKNIGILPLEAILEKHPWVKDVEKILKMLEKEKKKQKEELEQYQNAFENSQNRGDLDDEEESEANKA